MNNYEILCSYTETKTEESPNCPFEWRGSGCYEIDFHRTSYGRFIAPGKSIENTTEIFEDNLSKHFPDISDYCIIEVNLLERDASDDDDKNTEICRSSTYGLSDWSRKTEKLPTTIPDYVKSKLKLKKL